MQRIIIKDRYNDLKSWEITKLKGGYYLRQLIGGKYFGRGLKTSKKWIEHILEINVNEKFKEMI